jgi:hypothetical protein
VGGILNVDVLGFDYSSFCLKSFDIFFIERNM